MAYQLSKGISALGAFEPLAHMPGSMDFNMHYSSMLKRYANRIHSDVPLVIVQIQNGRHHCATRLND
jgi:hypothetical protein